MIYCVEDDESIRNLMIYTLNASGFHAEGFGDGAAFFRALETRKPRLIMLDVMLPGQDGLQILRQLRAHSATAHIPVIMATAKGTEFDKVTGLDLGADDYLAKPFGMMEMISRIKAVLRRACPVRSAPLVCGGLSLDPVSHTVTAGSTAVQLTLKEFSLLRLFLENPGKAFSRDQLLSSIWEADYLGETRTIDVHIGTLRTKLGPCGSQIKTVRGVGYRMEDTP